MDLPRFARPRGENGSSSSSPNLYVANCGPAVGISHRTVAAVFGDFGDVKGVHAADETGTRVIVCFSEESSARAALEALHGRPCPLLGGRTLHIRYSIIRPSISQLNDSVSVSLSASELNIPGLYLLHDFVTAKEEEELLLEVDARPWNNLAKRRVQHYGYEFCYQVNEYPPGVGLSPHIDTHSAFEGLIFSLSLAGPCIMEFRRYTEGTWHKCPSSIDLKMENSVNDSNYLRRAIYLPPRSMLLLSGEARYAWHHYIPHHKIDMVKDSAIRRGPRRVSFTFRKVRTDPCRCKFPHYCDSHR
ncbi:alkylated DNA repair protein alkB homolog 8 isoform X2 [Cucurbita maxima]|uniref:Alkylated DNA repair protein alkB homolog 8 isoform X2 n=1 Tax=Cucurbita maxima TaxID=3661 RepID=A0A6J1IHX5_CUCMA|nr:alkylated DNA repair protein alkB homolog 8 isoform X2 [Cucurbita maxima]